MGKRKTDEADAWEIIFRYVWLEQSTTKIFNAFREQDRFISIVYIRDVIKEEGLPLEQGGSRTHVNNPLGFNRQELEKRISDLYLLIGNSAKWGERFLKGEGLNVSERLVRKVWAEKYGDAIMKGAYKYPPFIGSQIVKAYKRNGKNYDDLLHWLEEWKIPYTASGLKKLLSDNGYKIK